MNRYERLLQRRTDPTVLSAKMAYEAFSRLSEGEAVKYAIGAMQPIDPEYTKNTYREGERVRNQLEQRLKEQCEYAYQGSTTNDTHIKAKSDIDLLAIIARWFWLDDNVPNLSPYLGDPKTDLRNHRKDSEDAAQDGFPEADVDTTGTTAITIEGASLRRRVDIVPATWFNTYNYFRTGDKVHRGIKVFDKNTGEFSLNRPFWFNARVEEKDGLTLGGMRKAARLMKSLKYDSDGRLDMSSYNITSIAWNMPDYLLAHAVPHELKIVPACRQYCVELRDDSQLRFSIRVPDDSRTVFGEKQGATLTQLNQLIAELDSLIRDIDNEFRRSFKRLEEARIEHGVG